MPRLLPTGCLARSGVGMVHNAAESRRRQGTSHGAAAKIAGVLRMSRTIFVGFARNSRNCLVPRVPAGASLAGKWPAPPRYRRHCVRQSFVLVGPIGGEPQELTLHRIDASDIGRDEVIAAAFICHHLKMAARERRGGARAAEMDEGREILLLASRGLHLACASEHIGDMAVQIDGRELDGVARDRGNRDC